MTAAYDLNEVADALRDALQGQAMFTVGGIDVPLNAYSEIPGDPPVPGIVLELDDVDWDVTMDRGSDAAVFVATLLLQSADSPGGQRVLRSALSSGGPGAQIKDVLAQDKTLGGLVSYAEVAGTRNIGTISYAGQSYIGAEILIEVVMQ